MLMPVPYGDAEAEYHRLMNGVAQWDVGIQRQIQINGPNAARLVQVMCVRDLSRCAINQGKYVAMYDHRGVLLNDPVVLKIDDNEFWLSIADNNMLMWSRAIAHERGFDVDITEPDISSKAEDVVATIFGDWMRQIKFFWFADASVNDIPLKLARSGYSKQGGFELYLMDGSCSVELWNIVREAGKPWDIGPGNPNPKERIASGLLSYSGDTDDHTNPFEARLDPYVDLDLDDDMIGVHAVRQIREAGPKRHQLGIVLDGQPPKLDMRSGMM